MKRFLVVALTLIMLLVSMVVISALATESRIVLETPELHQTSYTVKTNEYFTVSWDAVEKAKEYYIDINSDQYVSGMRSGTFLSEDFYFDLPGTYIVKVRAESEQGVSEWATATVVVTQENPIESANVQLSASKTIAALGETVTFSISCDTNDFRIIADDDLTPLYDLHKGYQVDNTHFEFYFGSYINKNPTSFFVLTSDGRKSNTVTVTWSDEVEVTPVITASYKGMGQYTFLLSDTNASSATLYFEHNGSIVHSMSMNAKVNGTFTADYTFNTAGSKNVYAISGDGVTSNILTLEITEEMLQQPLTTPILHQTNYSVKTNEYFTVSWDEVPGAELYSIHFFKNDQFIAGYGFPSTSESYCFDEEGEYRIEVYAEKGELESSHAIAVVSVTQGELPLETDKIQLSASKTNAALGETVFFTVVSDTSEIKLIEVDSDRSDQKLYEAHTLYYKDSYYQAGLGIYVPHTKDFYVLSSDGRKSNTITVTWGDASSTIPTLENFTLNGQSGTATVTEGEQLTLGGTVKGNGNNLAAVSVAIRNASNEGLGGEWHTGRDSNGNAINQNMASFDLSDFNDTIVIAGNAFGNTTLTPGNYIVQAYASNQDSKGFADAHIINLTIEEAVKPLSAPIPTQSSMTVNRGETVTISWAASEGAERYGVWFYDTDPATYVDAGSNLSVTHTFAHNSPANSPFAVQIYALAGTGENQKQSEPGTVLVTVGCAEGEHDFTGATVWDHTLYKEIPGDHQFHLAYADVYKQTCIECGMGGFEQTIERTEAQQEKEAHSYVNGVCQVEGCKHVCGHQYEDKLNNGAPIYVDGTDVWQNQGEAGHVCTSVEVETQCAYCQMEGTRVVENPWGNEVQAHMISTTVLEYGYDDFEHWPIKVRKTCSAPGCDYDVPAETEGKHEPHNMVEGNCTLCGNGVQSGTFKFGGFINSEADVTATYYYSDSYFDADATAEPNPHLATMSLCLELSAWTSFDTGTYWIGGEKIQNARNLLKEIGFEEFASNWKWESKPEMNSIGAVAAYKNIEDSTVIALAVRGGGYASEWGGNFYIGENGNHEGFEIARDEVLDFLKRYINSNKSNFKSNVKLWLVGFSRGGATANMTAGALLENKIDQAKVGIVFEPENVFAYTFEAPMGYVGDNSGYPSIKNYVLSYDLVPLVAPKDWGFGRYNDHDELLLESSLGTSRYNALIKGFKEQYNKVLEGVPYSSKNKDTTYRIDSYMPEFSFDFNFTEGTPYQWIATSSGFDLTPGFDVKLKTTYVPTDKKLSDTVDMLFSHFPGLRQGYAESIENDLTEWIAYFFDYDKPNIDWGKVINDSFLADNFEGIRLVAGTVLSPSMVPVIEVDNKISKAAGIAATRVCDAIYQQTGKKASAELENAVRGIVHTILDACVDSPSDLAGVVYYLVNTGFQCHWPEISLAWLMSKDSYYADSESSSIKDLHPEIWRAIAINCPVDVIVYDENGNEFASIRGENVTNTSDVHGVSITATGTKQVILPSDAGYSIQIIATDAGEMDYSVLEYNVRDRKYNLVQSYQNLPLTAGENYHGDIPAFHTDDYYDEESDGSTTKYTLRGPNGNELQPTTVLRGNNVYNATVSLSTNNHKGIVTGGGTFVATEYAQVEAVCMPTVEFLGWYRNGQLVSTEESYRFEVLEDIELVAHFSEGDYHTLHVTSTEGGIVPEGSCEVPATVQIQIVAEANEGYEFVRWETTAGSFDNPQKIDALFTMPSEDVTVMAVFQAVKAPPKTGDDTPLGLYALLLSLSACIVIVSTSKRKTKFGK